MFSPVQLQAITWTTVIINWTHGNKFSVKFESKYKFSIKENESGVLSAKWQPFCLYLNASTVH